MSDIMKIGFRLFIITVIAAIVMGITNIATEEPIRLQRIKAENKARQVALPQAEDFRQLDIEGGSWGNGGAEIVEIYTGLSGDNVVGYVFRVKAMGYVGDIDIILGINTNDEIEAVEIGEHSETPGLGAKVKDKAFLEQFHGKGTGAQLAAVKSLSEDGSVDASSSSTVDAESSATTETESSATVDAEGATTESDDSAITDTGKCNDRYRRKCHTGCEWQCNCGWQQPTGGATGSVQEIQAISGATVTSGAVTRAINLAIQYYNQIILSGGGY